MDLNPLWILKKNMPFHENPFVMQWLIFTISHVIFGELF